MIYNELRKAVSYHLWAGIALSIVIISVSILGRYEKSLLQTMGRIEVVSINMQKMNQDIAQMDSLVKRINALLPSEYESKSHREIMLLALDDIRMNIKGAEIKVASFEDKEGELSLQANIVIPVSDWTLLVNEIRYLQSLRFPYFGIKNIVIEEKDVSKTEAGAPACKIEGYLKMPAEKLI